MNRAYSSTNIDKTGRNRLKNMLYNILTRETMLARKGIQRKNIPSTLIITHNNTIFYAYRLDSRACNENNDHR